MAMRRLNIVADRATAPSDGQATAASLVLPPPENLRDATAMEQLAGTFGQLPGAVALEIAGLHRQRVLLLRGTAAAVQRVASQLYSVYRQVEVRPLPAELDPEGQMQLPGTVHVATQLHTVGPEFLPIKTWREFEGGEPLDAVLGAFDGLQPGECLLSQIIVRGAARPGWADPHLRQLTALKRRGYGADIPAPTRNITAVTGASILLFCMGVVVLWALVGGWTRWLVALPVGAMLGLLAGWLFSLNDNQWARVLEEEAAAKLRDQALEVEVRLFASAATMNRAQALLDQLLAVYQLFNTTSGNRWQSVALPTGVQPSDLGPVAGIRPAVLSVKELAGLWHMPVGESLELVRRQPYEQLQPLPSDVTHAAGAPVGLSDKGGQAISVSLSPEALRRNIFIIGKTQHGKSTLMEHIAAQWMRDPARSVLIVDPHGDLARRSIGLVPPERASDVVYIDLSDETRSVGLNLLDVGEGFDPDSLAENFVDVGQALWLKNWGPRMLIPLGFGLRALAHANLRRPPERQYTLLSLAPLLTCEPELRDRFLTQEVKGADRPDIIQYFLGEYAQMSGSQREQVISPVLSKSHAFERKAAIRRLIGQPRSTLQLFQAIRSRKIIVVNTNAGILGADMAGFIGSLFLNVMRGVIMRQTTMPREHRVPVSVVADEFQTMTGTDFGALLGELQKNGGNFVLGTQALDNLRRVEETATLAGSIFAGVATKVVFQVNGDDARYLVERELDIERLRAESLVNLPPYHAYVKTVSHGGHPMPVFLLNVASPLTPNPTVASQVLAQRSLYTVAGDEADRLARRSSSMLFDEHGTAQPAPAGTQREPAPPTEANQQKAKPPNSPDFIRHSAEVGAGAAADSETTRATQPAAPRPKARLPNLGAWGPTAAPDEAGFGNIADGIGRKKQPGRGANDPTAEN
ncbi:MAG: DUF87 domain-containing protein [Anaerolineales bacterium]|nr:DUF87 domain-containing protein [Anaerolineales bacterium]